MVWITKTNDTNPLKAGVHSKPLQLRKKRVVEWDAPIKSFKPKTNGVKLSLRTDLENTKNFNNPNLLKK
jgi:hypothetical protein